MELRLRPRSARRHQPAARRRRAAGVRAVPRAVRLPAGQRGAGVVAAAHQRPAATLRPFRRPRAAAVFDLDDLGAGLRIAGRQALQQLIKDVETGVADFQIILVYDVSRWGRFQDADESAYYEYRSEE